MSTEPTLPQGGPQRRRSLEMSLHREHPPAEVPGYAAERFLGMGAYGEVWVAIQQNTGRRVAVKFYTHRGGLDWSLLSREVEKLAFLFADRYVVQLIGVGWDAEPPYYIMEYLEHGSLAQRLDSGALPVAEAVAVFRDVAVGLVHAHGKGVLHCDLKPANILLDQDNKPRLADFGQSRLSTEQVPALGTLFYMAPEQADLTATPDARWDVYALGALLYCMLTGSPPFRTEQAAEHLESAADLPQRLAQYRRLIREAQAPAAHRRTPGVDRDLAEIIERCLERDPARRYANAQAVLDALDQRGTRRARRPLMVLGVVGPALVLLVAGLFAWRGFSAAVARSSEALVERALENEAMMADYVAGLASKELDRRSEAVEQVAGSRHLPDLIREFEGSELARLSQSLSDPKLDPREGDKLRETFRNHPKRLELQRRFGQFLPPWMRPAKAVGAEGDVASWFFCDRNGVSAFRLSRLATTEERTVGRNYAWRSFFHGGNRDYEESWRPPEQQRLPRTGLSAVFRSQAHGNWIVAVATPVLDPANGEFLGVVALTIRANRFVELRGDPEQFAVLVDLREGEHRGAILQHPLFDQLLANDEKLPARLQDYRLAQADLPSDDNPQRQHDYRDPLAADVEGSTFDRHWLAQMRPVRLRGRDSGWVVIVQEAYDAAIGSTMSQLRRELVDYGMAALGLFVLVILGLWALAARLFRESHPARLPVGGAAATERSNGGSTHDIPTSTFRAHSR